MITIRIEYVFEEERERFLKDIEKSGYLIIDIGNVKKSKNPNSSKYIQYVDIVKK